MLHIALLTLTLTLSRQCSTNAHLFSCRDSLRSQDDWLKLHTHYNHVGKMLMTAVSTHAGGSNDADVVEGEIHTGHAYAVLGYQQVTRISLMLRRLVSHVCS